MPLLAALIFALHPLNTQAVTYISSRSSIMATIFYLATIILFFKGSYKKKNKEIKSHYVYMVGAIICFMIGILCKLIIISLPAILFAYHYYFISKQNIKTWCNQQWQWIVGTSGFLISAFLYKQFYGGGFLRSSLVDFTALDYFRTQIGVIPFEYFRKMVFPFNLTIDPDFPVAYHWMSLITFGGIVILGIYLAIWIKLSGLKEQSKIYGPEAFGFLWILITLSPTSSFMPLLDVVAEHRTYLPLVGFSIVCASILARFNYFILQSVEVNQPGIYNNKKISGVTIICVLLILVSFLVGTRE